MTEFETLSVEEMAAFERDARKMRAKAARDGILALCHKVKLLLTGKKDIDANQNGRTA